MIMRYADPFEALFAFQRALENRLSSDWLADTTAGTGTYPPINVFQQGDDLVAIIELPGVNKEAIQSRTFMASHLLRRGRSTRASRCTR